MNLLDAKLLGSTLINEYLDDFTFEFDVAKTRFGRCSHALRKITISKHLTMFNNEKEFKDTLLHEIAHALVGTGNGHNEVWKNKCIEIGCRPERFYLKENINMGYKYNYECPSCDVSIQRHRKLKKVGACAKCCKKYNQGKFSEKYILEIVKNNMKYIIGGDEFQPRVIIGNTMHSALAETVLGKYRKPRSAGHMKIVDGKVEVYGKSIGFGIEAKPEDAIIISRFLGI